MAAMMLLLPYEAVTTLIAFMGKVDVANGKIAGKLQIQKDGWVLRRIR